MRILMLRVWHGLFGHPGHGVIWGETRAKCRCGESWGLYDLYPFM